MGIVKRLAALAILAAVGMGCAADEPAEPAEPTTAKELFEGCMDPWDGNHDGFETLIRAQLNDPGSMETHGTYSNADDSLADGEIRIRLDYGARNALGGMVRTDAIATMGLDCRIVTVIDYGF